MHRLFFKEWDLELIGSGRAFEETAYALPRQRLALDGGWGRSIIFAQPNLFVSHLHMDHALGLARYVVNRQKMGDGACRIMVPAKALAEAQGIVAAWQRAEGRRDPIDWVAIGDGSSVQLENNWSLEGFETPHTIPSVGFVLKRRMTRVKSEFADLPSQEIGRLVREGKEPVVTAHVPVFAYCGDTAAGVFDRKPFLYDVRVLLTECTFIGAFHESLAEKYGHTQWEELLERADRFKNDALVLTHFSKRYHPEQIWEHLNQTAPAGLRRILRPLINVSGTDDRSD